MNSVINLPNPIDAVLFDLDGTLVETNIDFPLMRRKVFELIARGGLDTKDFAELDILAMVDTAVNRLTSQGLSERAESLRIAAMNELEEIELRHARDTREIPFARELVAELRQRGIKIGIVTRNCRQASKISLSSVGIRPDALICREDSDKHKPHPQPLIIALRALSARPEASVMVGDHLMDIESGKAAGMYTIGFLRENRPPDFFDVVQPDLVVRDLQDVLRALTASSLDVRLPGLK
ncbi:MAG: HAD-IA family hydrolase [Armatimonadetes bacterium]|nr:HAD-IA family hydrolase [Armatimonadota bacterium]